MKRIYFTLLIVFSALFALAQSPDGDYNPFVAEGIISPAPLLPVELNGTGVCQFKVGNTGGDALTYTTADNAMRLTITLGRGVPNVPDLNATTALDALSGTFKSKFDWTYDVATRTYSAVQNQTITFLDLNATVRENEGTIIIQYKVTENSTQGVSGNGFNVNITPPPYSMTSNTQGDDGVSSFTWTEYKDYGDAPESYGVADHVIDNENYLGLLVDGETVTHTTLADGDDNQGVDDEDGVVIPPLLQGSTVNITISAIGLGYINAFIDWNGDGDFTDAGEKIISGVSISDGTKNFPVTVPWTANSSNPTYARFRFAQTPRYDIFPTGSAESGEVEDYQVTIICVPPETPLATVTQPTCDVPSGIITVDIPIGTTLEYSLDETSGWQSTPTFSGLLPDDTYTVYVRDNTHELACTSSADFVIAPVPDAPATPVATVTQPTCAIPTGSILVTTPVGATLEYSIDGTTWQASVTFAELVPGDYTVRARSTDNPTCVSSAPFTVNDIPVGPDAPVLTVTQPTCSVPSGSITITDPVGLGYTYFIDGDLSFTNPVITNLAPGSWSVTVRDPDGCTSEATLAVINPIPDAPAAPGLIVSQPTCDVATGSITILGPPPGAETYSINGVDYTFDQFYGNLTSGTYTVTMKDVNDCVSPPTMVVINAQPVTPVMPTLAVTQPGCLNATGTIAVSAPVSAGYTYSIGGAYQASPVFTEVAPGTYTVTVKSDGGCVSEPALATVDNQLPPAEKPVLSLTQPTCEVATGIIEIVSPLGENEYSIDGVTYTFGKTEFTGLVPGTYTVTVRNSYGCISEATVAVISAAPGTPETPVVSITHPTCEMATGTITVTSPIGPQYLYSVDGTTYTSTTAFTVTSGTYNVTVGEIDGCISAPFVAVVNAQPEIPAAPVVEVTQPDCLVATGSITVTSPVGEGFTYSIAGDTFTATSATTLFEDLLPGVYSITAISPEGCVSAETAATINAQPIIPKAPRVTVTQPDCLVSTGSIEVNGLFEVGSTFSIDGAAYTSTTTFADLIPGTYSVTLKSLAGCVSAATQVTINEQPETPVAPTLVVTHPNCLVSTGSIAITAPLETGYTFSIVGETFTATYTTALFEGLAPGTYTVTVVSAEGCISPEAVATIDPQPEIPAAPELTITQPDCVVLTGSIQIISPLGQYDYSVDGSTYTTTTLFAGLEPGTYSVTVRNASGCVSAASEALINLPPPPIQPGPSIITYSPDCSQLTGTIEITEPSDDGYTFSIDGTTYTSTTLFENVEPGEYQVTYKTGEGCVSVPTPATVNEPPVVPVPVLTVTQPTCGLPTGTIEVTSPLGEEYSYQLTDNVGIRVQTSTTFEGLEPGTYPVKVIMMESCFSESVSVTIYPPVTPEANAGPDKQLGCAVTEVNLEGSSVTEGVSFMWEGPGIVSGGDTPTPLVNTGGTYTLTVTHIMSQCTATDVVEVTEGGVPPVLVLKDGYCIYLTQDGRWTLNAYDIAQITAGSVVGEGGTFTFSRRTFECRDAYPPYTAVEVTATDAGGCVTTGTFNLMVLDTIAPVAKCRNITVQLDAFGQVLVVPGFVNDGGDRENVPGWAKYYKDLEGGSFDNCGIAEMYLTKSIFTREDVGDNQVVLTVIDPSGNIAECEATVTVVDPYAEEAGVPGEGEDENEGEEGQDPGTVVPNIAPTLADVTDIEIMEKAMQLDVQLTGISAGEATGQQVKITAVADNPSLITGIAVVYENGTTGQLVVTVAPGMSGESWITVTVKDDGGTANGGVDMIEKRFKVTVTATDEEVTIGITDPDGDAVVTSTIDLTAAMGFKLYPNPTRGKVNIEMNGTGIRDTQVSVYTINGIEVFRKVYRAGEQISVDLSPYVSGVYMVRTEVEGASFLRKVVLSK